MKSWGYRYSEVRMIRAICASLLVVCLLHLQIGNFEQKFSLNWNSAYALDVQTSSSTSGTTVQPNSRSDGKTERSSGRFGVKPEEMDLSGAGGFAEILVMVAVGLVGRGLIMCTGSFWQADVMLYVAGAVAFIAGEIMAYNKFNSAQKKLGEEVEWKKGLTGVQREALIKMRQTLEEMKAAAKIKYSMQMAASTAFTIAAAVAVAKYVMLQSLRTACLTADTAGASTVYLSAVCGPAAAAAGAKLSAYAATDGIPMLSTAAQAKTEAIEDGAGTTAIACPTGAAVCTSSLVNERLSWVVCAPPISGYNSPIFPEKQWAPYFASIYKDQVKNPLSLKAIDNYLDSAIPYSKVRTCSKDQPFTSTPVSVAQTKNERAEETSEVNAFANQFMDLIVSRANAGSMPMLGLGAGAIVMLTGFVLTQSMLIDQWIHGPLGRSVVFGITAALAVASSMATKAIIGKIDERIQKIDEILATAGMGDLPYLAGGPAPIDGLYPINGSYSLSNLNAIKGQNPNYPCVGSPTMPIAGSPGTVATTSNGCASLNALSLKSPRMDGKNVGFELNSLGSELLAAANSASNLADNIQGASSVSGATMNSAQALGGKLGFAQNALVKAQSALNDQLQKNGKKAVDFLGMRKDLLGKMRAGMMQDLKKQNLTGAQAMEKLGTAPIANEEKATSAKAASAAPVFVAPKVPNYSAYGVGDLNSAATTETASATDDMASLEGKIDINKLNSAGVVEDIIDKPDASIFQIISVRYLKSGMGHLGVLSKAPVATPSAQPEVKKETDNKKK